MYSVLRVVYALTINTDTELYLDRKYYTFNSSSYAFDACFCD
jgi:hypothetical protein